MSEKQSGWILVLVFFAILAGVIGFIYLGPKAALTKIVVLVDVTGSTNGGGNSGKPGPLQVRFRDEVFEVGKLVQEEVDRHVDYDTTLEAFWNKAGQPNVPDWSFKRRTETSVIPVTTSSPRWDAWWRDHILSKITKDQGTDISFALERLASFASSAKGRFVGIICTDGFQDGGDAGSDDRAFKALTTLRDHPNCELIFFGVSQTRANGTLGEWLRRIENGKKKNWRIVDAPDSIGLNLR